MFIPNYWLNIKNHMIFLQWFLDRMADDDWWPMQILIKCPNQIVRQVRKYGKVAIILFFGSTYYVPL